MYLYTHILTSILTSQKCIYMAYVRKRIIVEKDLSNLHNLYARINEECEINYNDMTVSSDKYLNIRTRVRIKIVNRK